MIVSIKENSWLAKLAARKLKSHSVAIVFGKTIHLFNTSRDEFLKNDRWVCHELVHVKQFQRYGFIKFPFLYLLESIRKGYRNNKYEVEARSKEQDQSIMLDFIIT